MKMIKPILKAMVFKVEVNPTFNWNDTMSKKPTKSSVTTASIEEQTAAFLKKGGSIEYVGKGTSGQVFPTGTKPAPKKSS